jgi:hypothetical protein
MPEMQVVFYSFGSEAPVGTNVYIAEKRWRLRERLLRLRDEKKSE